MREGDLGPKGGKGWGAGPLRQWMGDACRDPSTTSPALRTDNPVLGALAQKVALQTSEGFHHREPRQSLPLRFEEFYNLKIQGPGTDPWAMQFLDLSANRFCT